VDASRTSATTRGATGVVGSLVAKSRLFAPASARSSLAAIEALCRQQASWEALTAGRDGALAIKCEVARPPSRDPKPRPAQVAFASLTELIRAVFGQPWRSVPLSSSTYGLCAVVPEACAQTALPPPATSAGAEAVFIPEAAMLFLTISARSVHCRDFDADLGTLLWVPTPLEDLGGRRPTARRWGTTTSRSTSELMSQARADNELLAAVRAHCERGGRLIVLVREDEASLGVLGKPPSSFRVVGEVQDIEEAREGACKVKHGDDVLRECRTELCHTQITPQCFNAALRAGTSLRILRVKDDQWRADWCLNCCYDHASVRLVFKEMNGDGVAMYLRQLQEVQAPRPVQVKELPIEVALAPRSKGGPKQIRRPFGKRQKIFRARPRMMVDLIEDAQKRVLAQQAADGETSPPEKVRRGAPNVVLWKTVSSGVGGEDMRLGTKKLLSPAKLEANKRGRPRKVVLLNGTASPKEASPTEGSPAKASPTKVSPCKRLRETLPWYRIPIKNEPSEAGCKDEAKVHLKEEGMLTPRKANKELDGELAKIFG